MGCSVLPEQLHLAEFSGISEPPGVVGKNMGAVFHSHFKKGGCTSLRQDDGAGLFDGGRIRVIGISACAKPVLISGITGVIGKNHQ